MSQNLSQPTLLVLLLNFNEIRRWFRRCLEALVKNNPEAIKQCRDSSGSSSFRAVLAGKIDTLKTLNVGEDEGTFDDELQYCKVRKVKNAMMNLLDFQHEIYQNVSMIN